MATKKKTSKSKKANSEFREDGLYLSFDGRVDIVSVENGKVDKTRLDDNTVLNILRMFTEDALKYQLVVYGKEND